MGLLKVALAVTAGNAFYGIPACEAFVGIYSSWLAWGTRQLQQWHGLCWLQSEQQVWSKHTESSWIQW